MSLKKHSNRHVSYLAAGFGYFKTIWEALMSVRPDSYRDTENTLAFFENCIENIASTFVPCTFLKAIAIA
ncbi:hypothetical protein FLAVO9R_100005 [Flavobacterium sp. 9R]|nr:hypothetical protein FLAVO9R_100005 [Flavobacterium sp. 9R]